MKYIIIGAGRMGSLLAGALCKADAEVWAVDTYKAHVDAINQNGLTVVWNSARSETYKNIRATANAEDAGKADAVILMVNGIYTKSCVGDIRRASREDTIVITLQNGLGNERILTDAGIPEDRIVHGVIPYGGNLTPGHMEASIPPNIPAHIGPVCHVISPKMRQFADDLIRGGLNVDLSTHPDQEIWVKLCANCIANVACGLTRCNLGHWYSDENSKILNRKITEEIISVGNARGIPLTIDMFSAYLTMTREKAGAMASHFPSTAQDMKAKRPTEVDFLNGAVYREGQECGIETPYNEMLYRLCKVYEAAYDIEF